MVSCIIYLSIQNVTFEKLVIGLTRINQLTQLIFDKIWKIFNFLPKNVDFIVLCKEVNLF